MRVGMKMSLMILKMKMTLARARNTHAFHRRQNVRVAARELQLQHDAERQSEGSATGR